MVGLFRQYGGVRSSRSRCVSARRSHGGWLPRAVSTVSREVARHGGRPAYRASPADGEAWQSALRPPRCLLSISLKLRDIVASKLMLDWSPKQISGWLKTQYPDDESMRVSHETIYRSLFIQARGALKKELLEHLRSPRRIRRSRHSRIFKDGLRPSPSAKGPLKWKTGPFRGTGRAISCVAQEQSHRDPGGTPVALCHADQDTQQRYGAGCGRIE